MSMFNDIDWNKKTMKESVFQNPKNSEIMRRETLDGPGPRHVEKLRENHFCKPKGRLNSVAAHMLQRF